MTRIVVHIDRLRLRGVRAEDRTAVVAAFRQELGRVLADRALLTHLQGSGMDATSPESLRGTGRIARPTQRRANVSGSGAPGDVGRSFARGVGKALSR